jgi:hypothetical protein
MYIQVVFLGMVNFVLALSRLTPQMKKSTTALPRKSSRLRDRPSWSVSARDLPKLAPLMSVALKGGGSGWHPASPINRKESNKRRSMGNFQELFQEL